MLPRLPSQAIRQEPLCPPYERAQPQGENHKACFALWVAWYNFARVNTAVMMTPAMATGLTGTIWTMRDLLRAI